MVPVRGEPKPKRLFFRPLFTRIIIRLLRVIYGS